MLAMTMGIALGGEKALAAAKRAMARRISNRQYPELETPVSY
jgi:hypothetical protein